MSLLWVTANGIKPVTRHVSHTELADMYSADYDTKMSKVLPEMRAAEDDDRHPEYEKHGGPDQYVTHLAKDIAANGLREPIEVRGGNVVTQGHHRGLAAMKLRMAKIPIHDYR